MSRGRVQTTEAMLALNGASVKGRGSGQQPPAAAVAATEAVEDGVAGVACFLGFDGFGLGTCDGAGGGSGDGGGEGGAGAGDGKLVPARDAAAPRAVGLSCWMVVESATPGVAVVTALRIQ